MSTDSRDRNSGIRAISDPIHGGAALDPSTASDEARIAALEIKVSKLATQFEMMRKHPELQKIQQKYEVQFEALKQELKALSLEINGGDKSEALKQVVEDKDVTPITAAAVESVKSDRRNEVPIQHVLQPSEVTDVHSDFENGADKIVDSLDLFTLAPNKIVVVETVDGVVNADGVAMNVVEAYQNRWLIVLSVASLDDVTDFRRIPEFTTKDSVPLMFQFSIVSAEDIENSGSVPSSNGRDYPSAILGKVQDFLGVISESNKKLLQDAKENPDSYDIEVLSGNESKYIELDLMLGIADLHTPEAVAAAESAIACRHHPFPLSESNSGSDDEDSSDDDDDDENTIKDKIDELNNKDCAESVELKLKGAETDSSCKATKKRKLKKRPKIVVLP